VPRRRSPRLETRTARLKLAGRKKPHHFAAISPGISLGYRRCVSAGRWVVKVADGHGGNWTKVVGLADDFEDADGEHILSYYQAQDKARALARGKDTESSRPGTVAEAIADYDKDLIARGGSRANARRAKTILSPTLLSKPVALLTMRELKHLRDGLVAKGAKPASVNRDLKGLKAALNLAADHDPRITNRDAWRVGLKALTGAYHARNTILTDEQVCALVVAAYAEDPALGLLVEAGAVTGARPSQLERLEVGDLELDHADGPRLLMPSSRKGKGVKRIDRNPVPILGGLARKLEQAAGTRAASAPLLLRTNGTAWNSARADHREGFRRAAANAGLGAEVTFYALRHSSIVRQLLAAVPVRLVAVVHDTSIPMIEKSYSRYIGDHADALIRRSLLDIASPAEATSPGRHA
jgi:integrase